MLVQKNTSLQGNIGMAIAISHFTMMGCIVSIPLNDIQDYDLVAEIEGVLKKIQVKTTRYTVNGKYKVNLNGGNRHFTKNTSDYLFIVDAVGTKYFIPREHITVNSGIVLGDSYSQYIV